MAGMSKSASVGFLLFGQGLLENTQKGSSFLLRLTFVSAGADLVLVIVLLTEETREELSLPFIERPG